MNELFQKLAKQADAYAWQQIDEGANFDEQPRFFAEKFAELIVRECAQLLFDESERLYAYSSECDNMRDSGEAELCAEKCMDNIKMIEEHFGVEE